MLYPVIVNCDSFDIMAAANPDDLMFDFERKINIPHLMPNKIFSNEKEQFAQTTYNTDNNNDVNFQRMSTSDGSRQTTTSFPENFSTTSTTSEHPTVEAVMPGIYFTKNFLVWNEENLRAHNFTHIIIIDKHIQELYYPSPVFKLATLNKNNKLYDATSPFDYFCNAPTPPVASLNFSKEFEAIDLNFGEKSYLTTVLPNCYRAVRFINKALQSGGTILVIDCNGGEQKCLTIVVAYQMFKHNISFKNAFARVKSFYKKADLDRFYVSQLYEYEPILQVQRAHSRGHSCSRELHAAILKRKKSADDEFPLDEPSSGFNEDETNFIITDPSATNAFLQNLNPLSHFNASMAQQTQQHQKQQQQEQHSTYNHHHQQHILKQQMTTATDLLRRHTIFKGKKQDFHYNETANSYNHITAASDDYAME